MNYQGLMQLYEGRSVGEANGMLRDHFVSREIDPKNIDLGRLYVECFGWHSFHSARSAGPAQAWEVRQVMTTSLQEAEGATGTDAFLNIIGQIAYSTTLEAYQEEPGVFAELIPEVKTAFLDGEKIAGITVIDADSIQIRDENKPYALLSVGEDWIRTPVTKDRGGITAATWESVFADRTGQYIQRLQETGKAYKINREERAIDCVIDENTTAHRYNWRDVVIASYGDNSGTHTFDNLAASNALVDWSDIDVAEQVFNGLVNPYDGRPILIEPRHLVVTKQLEQTARRILRAGEIRVTTPGYATSGSPTQTNVANPYSSKYELKTSRLLASRLGVDTSWFLGDISAYAKYMVVRPFSVDAAPPNMPQEFHSRIIAQQRVSEHAAYVVVQPRAVVKSTA